MSVYTDEVWGGADTGGSAVRKSKDIGAVPAGAAVDAGDVDTSGAVVVAPPSSSPLGAEWLEHLMPSFCGLESADACGRVVTGRVDNGVLGEDGDTPSVA